MNNSIIEANNEVSINKQADLNTILDIITRSITNNKDFEGSKFFNSINQYVWNNNFLRTCLFFSNIGVLIYLLYVLTYKGLYRLCLYSIKRSKRTYRRLKSNWEDFKLNYGQRILNWMHLKGKPKVTEEVIILEETVNTSFLAGSNLPFIDAV